MRYLRKFHARYLGASSGFRSNSLRECNEHKIVLVAGGAGFLGSHLCERLLQAGHQVYCADNFSTGLERNIAPLLRFDGFSVIAQDIAEPIDLDVDEIYHLARPALPPHCQADPVRAMQTYVTGSLNLLELAAHRGARILQVSVADTHDDLQLHPRTEGDWSDSVFIGRSSSYKEGRRCAEALFSDFHRLYDVDVRLVRIFNAYGPRMRADESRIISNFVLKALTGKDITIYGDASRTRSFSFADDLIDGFIRIMASPASLPVPIDLGNPMEFSIGDVAEQVIGLAGARSNLILRQQSANAPRQHRPDISLAMQEFGWCPKMDLSGGLLQTIGYFDRLLARSKRLLPEPA
ncbi:NAD-dependent epimerase/dehydratase family protein [Ensifer sp. LCM 4579]|uniref:NAD-dependent epimerase/dehydratase family protein n=1 Tax=Ensifer sp. LCM 4579 TaxID=1848292 RepID=UPI0008D8DCD3|nr:NAD-dependent epimerase/dehydratase family protein [Ensifer sp. LCM 4579]OHV72811.1 NAD-dependent dehydratase [Ensifer sp. LCM 4579]